MDSKNKNKGKKGGKKERGSAAAEEQRQREESSHDGGTPRQIAESDWELPGPSTSRVPVPAPPMARPGTGSQETEGEAGGLSPPPPSAKKRRREAATTTTTTTTVTTSVAASRPRRPVAVNPQGYPVAVESDGRYMSPAGLQRWRIRRALESLERVVFAQPTGQKGRGATSGDGGWAQGHFIQLRQMTDNLCAMADDNAVSKRVEELEKLVDSLKKELRGVRIALVQAKRAKAGAPPAETDPPPEGPPRGRVSAREGSQGGEEEGWATVVRRGRGRGAAPTVQLRSGVVNPPTGAGGPATAKKGQKAPKGQEGARAAPKGRKGAVPVGPPSKGRLRLPRNPAVLLTATGGATYASLLKRAQEEVDLADIGIIDDEGRLGLLMKRARNGGYLLEVTGADSADKADRLARELEEVLQGEAKIARPVKYAEVRVTGLGDDVAPEKVAAVLVGVGGCTRADMVLGELRRSPGGLGAIWCRLPLAAAKKLVAKKGLRMGWTYAGVQLLEERPLQCYRCLKFGHLAAACKDPRDLKGRCFRCGGADHIARACRAAPHCLPCEKAGWPPGHRMGGRACQAASSAWRRKGGCPPPPARAPVIAPGRSRGRGLPPPDEPKGAGAEGDFVVPKPPAPREKGGRPAKTAPPPSAPEPEAGEAAETVEVSDVLSCSQVLPESQDTGRSVVDDEEAALISSLFVEEGGSGELGGLWE